MGTFSEINTQPSRAELVKFGLILLAASWIAAGSVWWRGNVEGATWLATLGVGLLVVALVRVIGRLAYIGWMTLGVALGRVTSPIVLLVVYVLLVVPVGVAFRFLRRDMLRRRPDEGARSYWEEYPRAEGIASYLRQS